MSEGDIKAIAAMAAQIALDQHESRMAEEIRAVKADVSVIYGQTREHDKVLERLDAHAKNEHIHHATPCPIVSGVMKWSLVTLVALVLAAVGFISTKFGARVTP